MDEPKCDPWDEDAPPEVREWFETRPECVQKRIREFPPGRKYLLTTTGHVVRMFAYSEAEDDDGNQVCDTCQILVLQDDNGGKLHMERRVFGIPFENLIPVPEGWVATGDRPLEEMDPALAERIRELQRNETA